MKHLLNLIVLLALMTTLNGQERGMNAISTAGSTIESKNLVVSWTIGEDLIDFTLLDGTMRQPPGSNANEMKMKDGTLLKVYPTLTTGLINVEIRRTEQTDLRMELLDLKGVILKKINVDAEQLQIDLSDYVQGGYYLRVSNRMPTDQVNIRITKV